MAAILNKALASGKKVEIFLSSKDGAAIDAFVDGEYLASGHVQKAKVAGYPDVTAVAAGKIGLTATEERIVRAAVAESVETRRKAMYAAHYASKKAERRYDNAMNEGGEGFNPYRNY